MTWLLPTLAVLDGIEDATIRSVGEFNKTAYLRAYHIVKRRRKYRQTYTPEQKARRVKKRMELYYKNLERERANARARYARHRERYAAASRERQRLKREGGKSK